MDQADLLNALRELLLAAQDFESRAVKHKSIDPQRLRLREALTQAQLVLSVVEREQQAARGKRYQEQAYALLRPPERDDGGRAPAERPKRQVGRLPPKSKERKG